MIFAGCRMLSNDMKKIWQHIIVLLLIGITLGFAWKNAERERNEPVVFNIPRPAPKAAIYPQWPGTDKGDSVRVPFVGKDFVGFKEALAFNESGGRYDAVNSLGFMGKYQFGPGTLKYLGIKPHRFLHNPQLQEEAFRRYVLENRKLLAKEIKTFAGKRIHGIKITESGILAAAHLAGAGAVKRYLHSYGKLSARDAFGTRIEDYLRRFADYDLSGLDTTKVSKH